jgi:hypothetical protein
MRKLGILVVCALAASDAFGYVVLQRVGGAEFE